MLAARMLTTDAGCVSADDDDGGESSNTHSTDASGIGTEIGSGIAAGIAAARCPFASSTGIGAVPPTTQSSLD